MNESVSVRRGSLLALLLAMALGACGPAPVPENSAVKGAAMGRNGPRGGHFTLTDQNGQRVSDTNFNGRYRLIYFGYTFCPDVCPVDMRVLGAGLTRFEQQDPALGAKVQPIFVSVDPARDTPQVLRQFVANFHPRLIGLTGTPEELARVARDYGASFTREEGATPGSYLMNHSRVAVLYSPENEPLTMIPYDRGPDAAAAELARWVR
jgi:protein SCO1/2